VKEILLSTRVRCSTLLRYKKSEWFIHIPQHGVVTKIICHHQNIHKKTKKEQCSKSYPTHATSNQKHIIQMLYIYIYIKTTLSCNIQASLARKNFDPDPYLFAVLIVLYIVDIKNFPLQLKNYFEFKTENL
jgi:hypothetical protein